MHPKKQVALKTLLAVQFLGVLRFTKQKRALARFPLAKKVGFLSILRMYYPTLSHVFRHNTYPPAL